LRVALCDEEERRLDDLARWQRQAGLRVEPVSKQALMDLEPKVSPKARSGLWFPDDAQVDPPALVKALELSALAKGVSFRTGTVRRILTEGDRVQGLSLDHERISAGSVVLAAGSWSGLVEGTSLPASVIEPVRGQMVLLSACPPIVRRILFSGHGYVVARRDGRVLVGSTMEKVGFQKGVTAFGLSSILSFAMELVPELASLPVTATWSNFRPRTRDGLPLLGRSPIAGLYLATGHFRNGILLAPVTAELIADLVLGKDPSLDLAPYGVSRLRDGT
jgi:glycine oxidase